jgi:hypothetical protein
MGRGIGVPAQREMVVRGVVESFVEVSFSQKTRLWCVQARDWIPRSRSCIDEPTRERFEPGQNDQSGLGAEENELRRRIPIVSYRYNCIQNYERCADPGRFYLTQRFELVGWGHSKLKQGGYGEDEETIYNRLVSGGPPAQIRCCAPD